MSRGNANNNMKAAEQKRRSVLILDDDPDVLEYASVVFTDCGFKLIPRPKSQDLSEALAADPDLIMVDLLMPGEDGIETLHRLAAARITCPLIVVSMCSEAVLRAARSVAELLGFEVLGFLRKPFYKDDVLKLTETLAPQEAGAAELKRLMDSGCIINHYQPTVDLHRCRVAGLEARARFHHPQQGIIAPLQMFRWARRLGVTDQIEAGLLKSAVLDALRIADRGFRLPMSVNLSTGILKSKRFPEQLEQMCRKLRFLLSQLTIDVSETEACRDLLAVKSALTRLSLRGCSIALEYGARFFARGEIENLPLNELKLVPALVQASMTDQRQRNALAEAVEHATELDLQVTAIGVESAEQLGLLLDLGVRRFQGRFFSDDKQFDGALYYLHRAPEQLREFGMSGRRSASNG